MCWVCFPFCRKEAHEDKLKQRELAETLVPRVGMSLLKHEKHKLSVWGFFVLYFIGFFGWFLVVGVFLVVFCFGLFFLFVLFFKKLWLIALSIKCFTYSGFQRHFSSA